MAVIDTKLGPMDEALLVKTTPAVRTGMGVAQCTEWHYNGELVKRDINFTPNQPQQKGNP